MDITHVPLLAGASMLLDDDADVKRTLAISLVILLAGVIVIEAAGLRVGSAGQAVTIAVSTLLGYFFGKKEVEAQNAPLRNN